MSDELSKSLNMRPLQDALQDNVQTLPAVQAQEPQAESDPYFDQAAEDAAMVRENLLSLLQDGAELFADVKAVAMNTQDPDQYSAAARMFSELVKTNKELMGVHKDVFSIKPAPVETPKQQADQINNIFFTGTPAELQKMIKESGVGRKPYKLTDERTSDE